MTRYSFPLNPYNQQRQFEKPVWVYPAHLAMYATYLRDHGHLVYWGVKHGEVDQVIETDNDIKVPFDELPYPDRDFTDAKNKRWQSYGNYKFHPATHMMASNLCWYGKCTFCIDTEKLREGSRRTRTVAHVIEEIDDLIANGYKEVFDDSGTFPVGRWLDEFCDEMMKKDRYKKIKIGCNMKPVNLDYNMMADAGFRFILVGIESANQNTLDQIEKGQSAKKCERYIKNMADAGLEPHGTFMTGYEWETEEDEKRTIEFCHHLLKKGHLKTAQASVYSPPRTRPDPDSVGHKYLPRFYDVYKSPQFWITKVKDIKCWEDFTYLVRGARLVVEEKWRKFRHEKSN